MASGEAAVVCGVEAATWAALHGEFSVESAGQNPALTVTVRYPLGSVA